jgi:hypothetical protein
MITAKTTNGRARLDIRPGSWALLLGFLSRDNPAAAVIGTAIQQIHVIFLLSFRLTGFTESKDLKPMALNLKTCVFSNNIK